MARAQDLFRPVALRIVEALLPGRKSLTELSESIGLKKPSLLPYLRTLAELGVVQAQVTPTPTGRESFYELLALSIHVELRPASGTAISWMSPGLVHHELPLASQIEDEESRRDVLAILGGLHGGLEAQDAWHDTFLVLFGSVARGQATWKSDIDLLFVMPDETKASHKDAIQVVLAILTERTKHAPKAHFSTRTDFLRGRRTIDREAAAEGIVLHDAGGDDDLWRIMTRYKRIGL